MRKCVVAKRLLLLANQPALRWCLLVHREGVSADGRTCDRLSVKTFPTYSPWALLNTPVQRELLRTSLRVLSLVLRQVNPADLERLIPRDTTASATQTLGSPPPGKGKRLKQAKDEATAEIDHYRLQREKEFRNKQTNVSKKPTYVLL